jgi:hypothetical protein
MGLIRFSPGVKTIASPPAALAAWQTMLTALPVGPPVFLAVKLHRQP